MLGVTFIAFLVFTSIPLSDGNISTYCVYALICVCLLVLDPALIGLSLAYGVSLSDVLQLSVRLSAEVENLV